MQLKNARIFFSATLQQQDVDSVLSLSPVNAFKNSLILLKREPTWMTIPSSHFSSIGKKQNKELKRPNASQKQAKEQKHLLSFETGHILLFEKIFNKFVLHKFLFEEKKD